MESLSLELLDSICNIRIKAFAHSLYRSADKDSNSTRIKVKKISIYECPKQFAVVHGDCW